MAKDEPNDTMTCPECYRTVTISPSGAESGHTQDCPNK